MCNRRHLGKRNLGQAVRHIVCSEDGPPSLFSAGPEQHACAFATGLEMVRRQKYGVIERAIAELGLQSSFGVSRVGEQHPTPTWAGQQGFCCSHVLTTLESPS